MAVSGWLTAMASTRYREFLNVPGIARAHDYQRVFSYGLGGIAVNALGASPWRVTIVVTICVLLSLLAARRLVLRIEPPPLPLALVDLVLSTIIVAVATGSPAVALLLALIVGFAVIATFEISVIRGVVAVIVTTLCAVGIAMLLSRGGSPEVSTAILGFVVVALMLVVAILILAFFTMQSYRLRRSLTSREAELSTLLSVTPVVLATINGERKILAVAGVDSGWLGSPGEVVTGPVLPLVQAANNGHRTNADVRVGGQIFNIMCVPGPRQTVLLTAVDITDREHARQRLEELVRSKDGFIAAISHELRTPLTAILGFAEEVKSSLNPLDPAAAMVEVIAEQSSEMTAIIEDLLVAARADQGTITVVHEPLDLAVQAQAVTAALCGRLLVEPVLALESTPITGDALRIRQIVRNLVTNADRYGGHSVIVSTSRAGDVGILEVRDNGNAVAPELRERIFEPYMSSGPVRGQPAAMGLGLAVSRRLALLMDGDLTYDHVDGWSVFRLTLPAIVAAEVRLER